MNPDLAPQRTRRDTEKCKREKQNIWFRYKGRLVTRKSEACHSEPAGRRVRNLVDPRQGRDPSSAPKRGFGMTAEANTGLGR